MLSTITRQPLRTVKPHLLKTRHSNLQPGNAAWQIAVLQQNAKEKIDQLLKRFETERVQLRTEYKQNAKEEIGRLLKSFETERLQLRTEYKQNAREEIDRLQQNAREEIDRLQQNAKEEKDRLLKKLEQNSNLKAYSSKILNEYLGLKGKLNLRGALEYISITALSLKKIEKRVGTRDRLIALSNTPEFTKILQKVAEERNLIQKEIKAQVEHLYHEVSKIAHGHDGFIIIRSIDLTINERAAIVCFLELLNEWPVPNLIWVEWEVEELTNPLL
ncbi:hypothetical protein BDZ91DRAFT_790728 [Kalaharituber pfeilii]|nr:hypothetical protein BDZ91DRAFT_790728 [Kalaharituber pfeilii]